MSNLPTSPEKGERFDLIADRAMRLEWFAALSGTQLVELFNREVGNDGWTSARANHLWALRQTFEDRGIDLTAIRNEHGGLSYTNQIMLTEEDAVEFLQE